jgi:membrane-associated phospholipid phosphatase
MGAVALIEQNDELLKNALYVGVSMGATYAFTHAVKYTVNRERPYRTYPELLHLEPQFSVGNPSFPSGHTSFAFAAATALCLKYPKWYVIAPSAFWACSVGYSRMNLGVHYPSDVVAGALLGAGSAYLTYKINNWFWKKQENKKLIGLESYL